MQLFDVGIDLAHLRGVCEVYMMETKALNTEIAYGHAWKVFRDWCRTCGRDSLPASGDTVALYVAWLLEEKRLNVKTVRVKLSGIAWRHRKDGHPSPVTYSVNGMLRTAARRQRRKPRAKAAVTPDQLARVAGLDLGGTVKGVRDRTAFLIGFALSWRRSELASLDLDDIELIRRGAIVRLGRSKGDQEGEGRVVRLPYGSDPLTCPVRALKSWLAVRGGWAGPLFCSVNRHGTAVVGERISGQVICGAVQDLLSRVGADERRYGAHSLRAGMITAAAEQGADVISIQQRTGHRSLDMVLKYVRPVEAFRRDPLAGVL
ncbi:MAG: site-specific integrase [Bryobacteraceae bacterium]